MKKKEVNRDSFGFSTVAIHAGQEPALGSGAIMTPIYQTSTYVQESPGVHQGYEYSRSQNPTRDALEANIAALEQGKHGVCYGSGCAAADSIMHLLEAGDHVISGDDVYGGTYRIFENVFAKLGLTYSFVDLSDPKNLEDAIRPETKMLWFETPTNPLLKIFDIERLSEIARKANLLSVVDNTFASPYLQNPLAAGVDLVIHSTSKYMGGHSDIIGGAIVTNSEDLAGKLHYYQNAVGGVPGPFDCYLMLRSTKTLALRMERHSENALAIAEFLEARDDVEQVIYPFLASHPQHDLARRQMRAGGGMITIVLSGGLERAKSFLEKVQIFALAESLGAVESLIEHPAIMTHASIPPAIREEVGISDGLVRLSVGVEDKDDLIADLKQAL